MPDQPLGTTGYRPVLFAITLAVFMCLLDSHVTAAGLASRWAPR